MPVHGGPAIRRRMKRIRRNVNDAISDKMDEIADELLQESRDLAPQLTGKMIATAGTDKADARDSFKRTVFYTEPYAIYQHEGHFNPGPITATKTGAGRKFLQRPFDAKKRDMILRISREIERAIRVTVR